MTLDEAIQHCLEVAEELEKRTQPYKSDVINEKLYEVNKAEWDKCRECAEEHRQIAEWLTELKALKGWMRWIPTSERLPENSAAVLDVVCTPWRGCCIRSGRYYDGMFMNDNGDVWNATDKEIVAWMLLPQYKEDYECFD